MPKYFDLSDLGSGSPILPSDSIIALTVYGNADVSVKARELYNNGIIKLFASNEVWSDVGRKIYNFQTQNKKLSSILTYRFCI